MVEVEEIDRTAGGRPVISASRGERETPPGRTSTSLASALAVGEANACYGKGDRKRQVAMFVGTPNGTEFDGTVAILHFMNVPVTGKELLGREHPMIAEQGGKQRWLFIPILSVDGRGRSITSIELIRQRYFCPSSQGVRITPGIL